MATRKTISEPGNTLLDNPPGVLSRFRDPEPEYGDGDEETSTDRVLAVLQTIASDARAQVKVYRNSKLGREYCGSYTPEEFEERNLDLVREQYGAGEFHIVLYGTTPSGKAGILTRSLVKIAESRGPAAGMPVVSTPAPANDRLERLERLVQTALERPAPDPMIQMQAMLGMMAQMREAFGLNTPAPVQAAPERSTVGDALAMMRELREAAKEINPGESTKDGLGELVELGRPILDLVSQAMSQRSTAPSSMGGGLIPAVTVPASLATGQSATVETPDSETDDMGKILETLKLKAYVMTLCSMADRSAPVEEGAQLVYEKLPDELIDLLELPNWLELLSIASPELHQRAAWLSPVRDRVLQLFAAEDGNEDVIAKVDASSSA